MGKLIAFILAGLLAGGGVVWFLSWSYGWPIVKHDETETSRTVKRVVLWVLSILATTAVIIACLFLVRAAMDLVR